MLAVNADILPVGWVSLPRGSYITFFSDELEITCLDGDWNVREIFLGAFERQMVVLQVIGN
jgi:hypothetical protein